MTPDTRNTLYGLCAYIRAQDGRPYTPAGAEEARLCWLGFVEGYLNVCPPGERYKLNAAGLHWLDTEPDFVGVRPPYGWDGWPSEGGKWIGFDEYNRREAAERARVDAVGVRRGV